MWYIPSGLYRVVCIGRDLMVTIVAGVVAFAWLVCFYRAAVQVRLQERGVGFATKTFLFVVPLTLLYGGVTNRGEVWGLLVSPLLAFIIICVHFLFTLFGYRSAGLKKAYAEYDELQRSGNTPVIVLGPFGRPRVLAHMPNHVGSHTGMTSWVDKSGVHIYRIIPSSALRRKRPF